MMGGSYKGSMLVGSNEQVRAVTLTVEGMGQRYLKGRGNQEVAAVQVRGRARPQSLELSHKSQEADEETAWGPWESATSMWRSRVSDLDIGTLSSQTSQAGPSLSYSSFSGSGARFRPSSAVGPEGAGDDGRQRTSGKSAQEARYRISRWSLQFVHKEEQTRYEVDVAPERQKKILAGFVVVLAILSAQLQVRC